MVLDVEECQQSLRREFSHPGDPDIAGLYLVLNTFTYDIKYYLPKLGGWETTVGVNGMYQKKTNRGTEFIIPDYKEFDAGPFAFLQRTFNKLNISAGIRYDNRIFNNISGWNIMPDRTGFIRQIIPKLPRPVISSITQESALP
jgi:iron complex outermembrane receptor protein